MIFLYLFLAIKLTLICAYPREDYEEKVYIPKDNRFVPVALQDHIHINENDQSIDVNLFGTFTLAVLKNFDPHAKGQDQVSFTTYIEDGRFSECATNGNYFEFVIMQSDCIATFRHYKDQFEFSFGRSEWDTKEGKGKTYRSFNERINIGYLDGVITLTVDRAFGKPPPTIEVRGCQFADHQFNETANFFFFNIITNAHEKCGAHLHIGRNQTIVFPEADEPGFPYTAIPIRPPRENFASPYLIVLEKPIEVGQTYLAKGKIEEAPFSIRFLSGAAKFIMVMEVRKSDDKVVIKTDDPEKTKEITGLPFEGEFDIRVVFYENYCKILFGNVVKDVYYYQMPLGLVDHIRIDSSEVYTSRIAGKAFQIPYAAKFPHYYLSVGQILHVSGFPLDVANGRSAINFNGNGDNVLLHYKTEQGSTTVAYRINGEWHNHEGFPTNESPFEDNVPFDLSFALNAKDFSIYFNDPERKNDPRYKVPHIGIKPRDENDEGQDHDIAENPLTVELRGKIEFTILEVEIPNFEYIPNSPEFKQ